MAEEGLSIDAMESRDTEAPLIIEYGGPGRSDPRNRAVAVRGELHTLLDG